MRIHSPRHARKTVVTGLVLALGASLGLLPAPAAQAAGTPFIVIGTSDVSDSKLVEAVIEPQFEAKYPQYDLQYKPLGTGAALDLAKAGGGAAVIVHAASLENQFVAGGYSLEKYGRLAFWGDYVLAGPTADPAGVLSGNPHDVVGAFEKVAAAGAAGKANFVSRGGKPGTAVQERALWALTTGVTKCAVGQSSGGGARPSTTTAACDNPDTPDTYPTWYHTGDSGSQAQNVQIANTCNFSGGNCYVFTDRGTLKYLQSVGQAQNLKVLTRDNDATARGGRDALINVFHTYGVNPAAVPAGSKTDPVAAKLFLDFMTSSATQANIGAFLAQGDDPAFIPAASPVLKTEFKKDTLTQGRKTRIKGNIANAVPGYPALGGVTVNLLKAKSASPLSIPQTVATATTDAAGDFTFKAKLKGGKNYRIGVGQIEKIQLPTLTPAFGDLLSPTSAVLGTVGGIKLTQQVARNGRLVLGGRLKTKASGKGSKVVLYAASGKGKLKKVGRVKLKKGAKRFTIARKLAPGTYRFQLVVQDREGVYPTATKIDTVRVS